VKIDYKEQLQRLSLRYNFAALAFKEHHIPSFIIQYL